MNSHEQVAPSVSSTPRSSVRAWVRPVILLAVLVAVVGLAKTFGLGDRLGELRGWIESLGAWGPVVFVFLYAAATVAALPGSALTIAAGALFGSVAGVIVVSAGSTLGASLAFLVSRYFARDAVSHWLSGKEKFRKLDEMTGRHGAIMVAVTRLVPIFPFSLLNYGFGLTRVNFWTYVLWSWLCMLPGTVLYVVGADAFTKGLQQGEIPWPLVGAVAVAAVILTVLVRRARRVLNEREARLEGEMATTEIMPLEPPAVEVLPNDEYNARLVGNVHPPDWANPDPAPRYNLVVIGAGTAGLVTAAGAAGLGAKVALVERHLMGGDCLNFGCVPSKAIIRASRVPAEIRDAARFGTHIPDGVNTDFRAVMERMRRLRAGISKHDSAQRFRSLGVDVFLGEARFSGSDTVAVAGKTLRFKRAVIATGTRPAVPPIDGLAEAGYVTNETFFSMTELPQRLVVIGAGPIGCELAQAFARLGSQVTLVEAEKQILPREDANAARCVESALLADGVRIICGGKASRVGARGTEKTIHLECDGQAHEIVADAILVAVGRKPNVENLGLETVGVQYAPQKGVFVNDRLQTTNPRIYACGDVCLPYKFTHAADAAARIVIQNALFLGRKKTSTLVVPWCTYTSPEVAHVGMYEQDAEAKGIKTDAYHIPFSSVDRAILDGEEEGFVNILTERGTDKILGATIVARHAGELVSEITLAMTHNIGLGSIAATIHPYPTQAEAIRKAADAYNRTRLTPFVKKLFQGWLAWTR